MSIVALEDVKAGVQATGFTDDDVLLQQLADAAELALSNYLRRDFAEDFGTELPADLQQAVIMLVFHWYENVPQSDAPGEGGWPTPVKLLIASYRDLS